MVDDLLRRWHCDDRIVLREIVDQWSTIIGAEFASHTQPRAIHDKVLLIDVFNTVVRPRLEYIKDEVRQRVVDLAGGEVTDIRFVVGGTTPNRAATRRERKP